MEATPVRRSRASSTEDARMYRLRGHQDALMFALAIGLTRDYQNDQSAKKDVIDPSGDAHSVKSGEKKWQIFLYGKQRFTTDDAFVVMNGIGQLLVDCIEAFPTAFAEYQRDKISSKESLRVPMRKLAEKLQDKMRLKAFLNKSMFNGGEVDYLSVKHDGKFHVFYYKDVLKTFCDNLEVVNSRAITIGNVPEQKVLLRYDGLNLGEIEMRNDSPVHYREIRFNMIKPKVMALLFEKIPMTKEYRHDVLVYGQADRKFGRWKQKR